VEEKEDISAGDPLGSLARKIAALPDAGSADVPLEPDVSDDVPPRLRELGKYELVRRLGFGGMGAVYEARDRALGKRVAVKVLHDLLGTDLVRLARFRAEALVAAKISHPGTVQVLDVGEHVGTHYLVLELIEGGRNLGDLLRESWEVSKRDRDHYPALARLFLKVAEALHALHEANLVHRDVKPSNILLTPEGDPKVADFGLVKDLEGIGLTQPADSPGTREFKSPEQVLHREVDARSDVFSLGATLFEALTFARLFSGNSAYNIDQKILHAEAPDPRDLQPGVPRELGLICLKALEKDPGRRYATMAAMAADLRRFLASEPIEASPPGRIERLVKWARRHPTATVGILLSIVALTGSGAFGAMASVRAGQVLQLSALREVEALQGEADGLLPAGKHVIEGIEGWLHRATKLRSQLPEFEAMLAEVRARGEPHEDVSSGQDTEVQRQEIEYLRFLVEHAAGSGSQDAAPTQAIWLDPTDIPEDYTGKNELAEYLVNPDRENWGGEALGLELVQDALSLGAPDDKALLMRDTLSWALFANGFFDESIEEIDAAVGDLRGGLIEFPGPAQRESVTEILSRSQSRLRQMVRSLQSPEGRVLILERISRLEASLVSTVSETWTFSSSDDAWWHENLQSLVSGIEELEGLSERMEERIDAARIIEHRSIHGPDARTLWKDAALSISDPEGRYRGLEIEPVRGLLPLGPDPTTELWEFAHLMSGVAPVRAADGQLEVNEEVGLVLVLLPGGRYHMGASHVPGAVNFYPRPRPEESPVREHELEPFFISKFELTQAQWDRLTGDNPSQYGPEGVGAGSVFRGKRITGLHPLEFVSWNDAMLWLERIELTLPTEIQWEYAARAGTQWPWWTGPDAASLQGAANIGDMAWYTGGANRGLHEDWDDQYPNHAPVGSFQANAFGLHDMLGNVQEWCRDWLQHYSFPTRDGDGERILHPSSLRVVRGGSYADPAATARSAYRIGMPPRQPLQTVGIRPSRPLRP